MTGKKGIHRNSEVAKQIGVIRKTKGLQNWEVNEKVFDAILKTLKKESFYKEGNSAYYYDEQSKKLIQLNAEKDKDYERLIAGYNLNPSERIYTDLQYRMTHEAWENGKEVKVQRFAYFDKEKMVVYIFNNKEEIFRISTNEEERIKVIPNGDEGILFVSDPDAESFELRVIGNSNPLMDSFIDKVNFSNDQGLTVFDQKLILIFWICSFFFESTQPTKPIMAVIGPTHSGKTTLLQIVGKILYGKEFEVIPMPSDERDFDTVISNSKFVAFDNLSEQPKWLNDRLASAATGISIQKRELFTTNKMVKFKVKCFLSMTSIDPRFREDVTTRLLVIKLKQINPDDDGFDDIIESIMSKRNEIFTDLMTWVWLILNALKKEDLSKIYVTFRMADFATLVLKAVMGEKDKSDFVEKAKAAFERLKIVQRSLVEKRKKKSNKDRATFEDEFFDDSEASLKDEDRKLVGLINKFVRDNLNREYRYQDLRSQLHKLDQEFDLGTPQSFGNKLTILIPFLKKYWEVKKRDHRKTNYITFMKKPEEE